MSKHGLKIATEYGQNLPRFKSLDEARNELFRIRDSLLLDLRRAADSCGKLRQVDSPESLKELEKWYFDLVERRDFASLGFTRDKFERAISMYFGSVVVANISPFRWIVQEYAFVAGRYEIGVGVPPKFAQMLTRGSDLESVQNNKRRQSLFREFRKLTFYEERPSTPQIST